MKLEKKNSEKFSQGRKEEKMKRKGKESTWGYNRR